MTPSTSIFIAGTAVLLVELLPFCSSSQDAQPFLQTVVVDCLEDLNEARRAAGLSEFRRPDTPYFDDFDSRTAEPGSVRDELCGPLQVSLDRDRGWKHEGATGLLRAELQAVESWWLRVEKTGTFIYADQHEEEVDCKAAVNRWKAVGRGLSSPPPPFQTRFQPPYDANPIRSFVGLFTPSESPTVQCIRYTCSAELGPPAQRKLDVKLLLCIIEPPALVAGKAPFTAEQWEQIKKSIDNGSTPISTTAAMVFFFASSVLSTVFFL